MGIITLSNLKGGVGKTASTICLAGELVQNRQKVLIVDADPQAGATISCGLDPANLNNSLVDVLSDTPIQDVIITVGFGADILPANLDLALGDLHGVTTEREVAVAGVHSFDDFRRVLSPIRDEYDWILVDTQPSFSRLTVSAMAAADHVVIPVSCDVLGLRGLELMFRAIRMAIIRINSTLNILGVLPTMYDRRTLLSKEMVEEMKGICRSICQVFDPVHRSVRFQELPLSEGPIRDYAPELSKPYQLLAREVLKYDHET